jgi:hypothetical protein
LTTVASMKVRLDPRMVATSVHRLLAGMRSGCAVHTAASM